MKIQLFTILLIIKTFFLSQNGVEAGPKACTTNADCMDPTVCVESQFGFVCIDKWRLE